MPAIQLAGSVHAYGETVLNLSHLFDCLSVCLSLCLSVCLLPVCAAFLAMHAAKRPKSDTNSISAM